MILPCLVQAIVTCILSTDMSHHFALTQEFKKHSLVVRHTGLRVRKPALHVFLGFISLLCMAGLGFRI